MRLDHLISHFQNNINHLSTPWRTHSCVPRRDSSRRSLVSWYKTRTSVETSLDAARMSARATTILFAVISFSFLLNAQQPTATFQTSTQLVIQTVNVKDKNGKAIEGL